VPLGDVSSQRTSLLENQTAELTGVVRFLMSFSECSMHVWSESAQQPFKLLVNSLQVAAHRVPYMRAAGKEDPKRLRVERAGNLLTHLKYNYSC
jgi:hypothetical protein